MIEKDFPQADKPNRKEAIYWLEIEKILPNPYQPRKDFDPEGLKELAESIREYGILEPLIVTRKEIIKESGIDVFYELVAGERRLQAAKLVGMKFVPAIVKDLDSKAKLEVALIENIQRKDLNPVERARAFARLIEEFGLTQREIAHRIHKSREYVANTLRLLKLPEKMLTALEQGLINESQARVLLEIGEKELREKFFRDILEKRYSVRALKRKLAKEKGEAEKASPPPEIYQIKNELEKKLGKKVEIKTKDQLSELAIIFRSLEELLNFAQQLIQEPEKAEYFISSEKDQPEEKESIQEEITSALYDLGFESEFEELLSDRESSEDKDSDFSEEDFFNNDNREIAN